MNKSKLTVLAKPALRLALVALLCVGLSGCILRIMSGFVEVDDLGTLINLSFDDVPARRCTEREDFETGETRVDCLYSVVTEDGSSDIISTATLVRDFGVFGVIIDPLILQVPDFAELGEARVDAGGGFEDVIVTETTTFDVQPGVQSTAEAGHKFWILDLPPSVEGAVPVEPDLIDLDFRFSYRLPGVHDTNPVTLKAVFAGRTKVGADTYYFPMLPCTYNFAEVPDISIPVGVPLNFFIFDLLFLFMDNVDSACVGDVYDFTIDDPEPLACDADLDADVDRLDIQAIVGRRNTIAALDDPLDADADGMITVLDARRCVLQCDLPRCAIP